MDKRHGPSGDLQSSSMDSKKLEHNCNKNYVTMFCMLRCEFSVTHLVANFDEGGGNNIRVVSFRL